MVKPITGMLRRGLVLDLSVAFGMLLCALAPFIPPGLALGGREPLSAATPKSGWEGTCMVVVRK